MGRRDRILIFAAATIVACTSTATLHHEQVDPIVLFLSSMKERGYFPLDESTIHELLPSGGRGHFYNREVTVYGHPAFNLVWSTEGGGTTIEFAVTDFRQPSRYSEVILRAKRESRRAAVATTLDWLRAVDRTVADEFARGVQSEDDEVFTQSECEGRRGHIGVAAALRRDEAGVWIGAVQLVQGALPISAAPISDTRVGPRS